MEHKIEIMIQIGKRTGKSDLSNKIVSAHALATQLVSEAEELIENLRQRFEKVDKEFKKTLQKQITKYAFLQQKHNSLKKLIEHAERRLARRRQLLESILNLRVKSDAKWQPRESQAVVFCSACQSTEKGKHSATCSLMTAKKR